MPKCEHCGAEVTLPFQCTFCRGYFCIEHRLPENHDCPDAPVRTPLGHWKAKLETTKKSRKENSLMASEGDLHFVKKELPLFEPKKEKRKTRIIVTLRRKARMRPWYWFLLILLLVGVVLVILGEYYILIVGEYGFGWELSIYGAIILGFLLAVAALYFERWRRKWWQR